MANALTKFKQIPVRNISWENTDVESTSVRYVLFVLLPLWVLPGIADWYWHKRTDIEHTAGLQESIIHSLMMSEVGIPVALGLLFEINPLVLALMFGAMAVHEATAFWDVSFAVHHREVKTGEQHTHSFLEVVPMMAVSMMICLHASELRRLITGNTRPGDWGLRLKRPRLSLPYLLGIAGLIGIGVWLPYGNEIWRCVKALREPKRNTGFYKDLPEGEPEQRNC